MVEKELAVVEAVLNADGLSDEDKRFVETVKRECTDVPISSVRWDRVVGIATTCGVNVAAVQAEARAAEIKQNAPPSPPKKKPKE